MDSRELTYWDHLEEFRKIVLFYLIILFLFSIVSFLFMDKILSFLKKPLELYSINLNYFKPYEKFFVYIKLSFFSGLILSLPFLLLQVFSFVSPALKRDEKLPFFLFILLSFLIFIGSLLFAYFFVLPFALKFFVNFSRDDGFGMLWGVSGYFDFLVGIALSSIIVFQFPLLLLILLKLKIIDLNLLVKSRKFVILAVAIFAAIFSPPDIVSMFLVGLPLYLLFEIVLLFARIFGKKSL